MRKASFIWPWEKSVKKNTNLFFTKHNSFCVKQNYMSVIYDNPLFIPMERQKWLKEGWFDALNSNQCFYKNAFNKI